jgi:CheY-like chemotaxis protein
MSVPGDDVLVVDDNADIVDALELLLGEAGFATRPAYEGRQALDAVEARRPGLVLLDLLMPVMDGWECARILRDRYGATLPIVVVSAAEHVRACAESVGADGVMSKPADIDELVDLVGRFVPRRLDSPSRT